MLQARISMRWPLRKFMKWSLGNFRNKMKTMKRFLSPALFLLLVSLSARAQETYAEKLGFPKGSKVLILHVDDVGMSWDSNQGAIQALEKGVATSVSIMMPCSW